MISEKWIGLIVVLSLAAVLLRPQPTTKKSIVTLSSAGGALSNGTILSNGSYPGYIFEAPSEHDSSTIGSYPGYVPRLEALPKHNVSTSSGSDTNKMNTLECPVNRTVETLPPDFNARKFCQQFNESPRAVPHRIFYGVMFSAELDMLEVVLHETAMVVDKYVLIESKSSHSKRRKDLYFRKVLAQDRFKPFLHKIANFTYRHIGSAKTGWDLERGQRDYALKAVQQAGIEDGDFFLANMDLDEVFSRETVMRFKFCRTKRKLRAALFSFRYHLNCLQEQLAVFYKMAGIKWNVDSAGTISLYRSRSWFTATPFSAKNLRSVMRSHYGELAWHMSSFGSYNEIRFKLQNSPHRFVHAVSDRDLKKAINECYHNGRQRSIVELYPDMLPHFIRRNVCHFKKLGWLQSVKSS